MKVTLIVESNVNESKEVSEVRKVASVKGGSYSRKCLIRSTSLRKSYIRSLNALTALRKIKRSIN